jgi:hypothetical protein
MNVYDLLFELIELWGVGMERETVLANLQSAKASGIPESEIPALLRKWRDETIAAGEKEGHE